MNKHVSAVIAGLALCAAGPVAASHSHQGNLQVIGLAQVLAQQALGLSQQAQGLIGSGWGVSWQDRRAAAELAQFAASAVQLARSAQGCESGQPGHGNGGGNGGGYPGHGGWNGGGYPGHGGWNGGGNPGHGGWNGGGHAGGWNQPGPGQNPPGWPAPGHPGNGGWNGGGHDDDQIGMQLEQLFRDTWRQANDVERFLYSAPRLRPLVGTWTYHVCGTLRQLRAALGGTPFAKRESLREGIFERLFGR